MDFKRSRILSLDLLLIHFVVFERTLPARVMILRDIKPIIHGWCSVMRPAKQNKSTCSGFSIH